MCKPKASIVIVVVSCLCFHSVSISVACKYDALKSSLANGPDNLNALSEAFFPPVDNNPEFVTVVYNFNDIPTTETWYWSTVTSHFLHPYEVFQYISLFFVKPRRFYIGKVELNITGTGSNVTECVDNISVMQLLTQRVS